MERTTVRDRDVENISQEELEKVLAHLEKNPELIPKKILLEQIREIVTSVGNEGATENQSTLESLYRDDPSEKMLIDAVLNQVAIMCGYKLLRDDMISEAVRDIRDNSKTNAKGIWNWVKRVWRAMFNLDARQVTRLTHECEKLAAKHEALKMDSRKLNAELKEKEGQAQEIIEKANLAAEKRSQEIMALALATQQRAIDQAQELTKDSGARAERMQIENNRKLAEIENKIEAKEKEFSFLKIKTEEVRTNPDVVNEWRKQDNAKNKYSDALTNSFSSDSDFNKWSKDNAGEIEIIDIVSNRSGNYYYICVIYRWLVDPPNKPKNPFLKK